MANDPEIVLIRIKNRFDSEYKSELSAGYRNLAVNLRVVSAETLDLGIETHVCEVQLLLLEMAIIKVYLPQQPTPHLLKFYFQKGLLLPLPIPHSILAW
jgi:hypothetical protein